MHDLKGIIFSLSDVLAHKGKIDPTLLSEVVKLLKFLLSRGVQPVLVSNSSWVRTSGSGEKQPYQEYLSDLIGSKLPYYQDGVNIGRKQTKDSMQTILNNHGWVSSEVMYVGSGQQDVVAASNGGFPLLTAKWHGDHSDYGFEFASPRDIASFVDCCCLAPKEWFWKIEDGPLRVYSIVPLAENSRAYPQGAVYSTDAKNAVKHDVGNIRFWGLLMAARIHLSGLGAELDFVAPYPGHKTTSEKSLLMNMVKIVSGSLRARYLFDFILRHTDAPKSQTLRRAGGKPTVSNQLNSIRLNRHPTRTGPQRKKYVKPPALKGKTVLVVDDICTQGFSLESARAFFEAAGAKVILLSWLKTPGPNDYHAIKMTKPDISKPFEAYAGTASVSIYSNSGNVANRDAPTEIAAAYSAFTKWDWPTGI